MAIVYSNNPADTAGSVTVGSKTWSWSGGTVTAPSEFVNSANFDTTNKSIDWIVYNTTVSLGNTANSITHGNGYFINAILEDSHNKPASDGNSNGIFSGCDFVNSTVRNCSSRNLRGLVYGSVTVVNSVFSDNYSDDYGIVHKNAGTSNFSGSTFYKNRGGTGGAISSQGKSWIYISGTAEDEMLFYGNTAGAGGAVAAWNHRGQINIKGTTFTENHSLTDGGGAVAVNGEVIIGNGTDGTRTQFIGNTASSYGGAIYQKAPGASEVNYGLTVTDAIFKENCSYSSGGGAIGTMYNVTLTGNTFVDNYAASNGGALYINGGSATLTGNVFSGNTTNGTGGAVNITSAATGVSIIGGAFLTATDTIYSNAESVSFSGDIELNASITGKGFSAADAHFTLKNSTDIEIAAIDYSAGNNTIVLDGAAAVDFKGQAFTGAAVTVKLDKADTVAHTIATGFTGEYTLQTDMVKDSNGFYKGADELLELVDGDTSLSLVKKGLVVNSADEFYTKVQSVLTDNLPRISFAESMTINCADTAITLASGDKDTLIIGDAAIRVKFVGSAAARMFRLSSGCRSSVTLDNVEFSGSEYTANGALVESYGTFTLNNSLITGNDVGAVGITSRGGCITSGGTLIVNGSTFSDNKFTSNAPGLGGAAIYGSGTATITDTLFHGNTIYKGSARYCRGAAIGVGQKATYRIYGSTFSNNASLEKNYGAIYADVGANVTINGYNGEATLFENNAGGAFYGNVVTSLTIDNVKFINNDGCGAIRLANNGVTASMLTISNAEFSENAIAVSVANANATISNSKFLTATDGIYIGHLDGTVTFAGEIDIVAEAGITGVGTYIFDKGVSFTSLRDFSNVYIAVDGTDWEEKDTVIATGVSKIGEYGIIGNSELMLSVNSNNELVLSKIQETDLGENVNADFVGSTENLITSGEAKNFIANKTTEAANLLTSIEGGKISNALVGGAYAKATDAGFDGANIGNVELNFGELADVAAKVYAGGYLYGDANAASAAANAQMNVGRVRVNLDGGAVSTNMYGGAHVRDNGNAKVEMVDITVTAGNHGRIYAGGWAEKGAKSYVTTSNVIISGGTVDYLYGAGANADGETFVGTTNITIENDAVVNTIFMGGRYGYSYVDTVNLTFDGAEKSLTRLSGVSSAGMDYSDATSVVLKTDLTADLIDYVDKFTINEGFKLTANNDFVLGSRDNETGLTVADSFTTFNFVTDGFSNAWEAIAGIEDFTNAKFTINGVAGVWEDNVMAITSDKKNYTITKDESAGTITLAQVK